MNFYKHHIGDYAKKTSHLSWDEDMAYTRLMRVYYATEKPLPADLAEVIRLARAKTKVQKAAVEQVLREFFDLTEAGWSNGRCDEEMEAAQESFDESVSLKKNEKERQQRHRKDRKELFDGLRANGVVMPFDTSTETLRLRLQSLNGHSDVTADPSHLSRVRHASSSHPVTRDATAIQTPDSRLQKPDTRLHPPSASATGGQRGVGTFKKVGPETLGRHELARIPERHAKTTDELEREEAARAGE